MHGRGQIGLISSREKDSSNIIAKPMGKRAERIYKYLCKKYHKKEGFHYKRRSKVAGKRLRIKGRFVTRDQAF